MIFMTLDKTTGSTEAWAWLPLQVFISRDFYSTAPLSNQEILAKLEQAAEQVAGESFDEERRYRYRRTILQRKDSRLFHWHKVSMGKLK